MVLPLDHPSPQCLSHFSIQPPRASPTPRSFGEETQNPGGSLPEGPPENQEGAEKEKRLVQSLTQQGTHRVDQTPEAQPTPVATLKASPSWNVARTHKWGALQRSLHTQSSRSWPQLPLQAWSLQHTPGQPHPEALPRGISTPHPTLCPASPGSSRLHPQGPDIWGRSPPRATTSFPASVSREEGDRPARQDLASAQVSPEA